MQRTDIMQLGRLIILTAVGLCFGAQSLIAGNPDRQGEAGAVELLFNPWARSAGMHSMSTSFVSGAESMRINIAGLARTNKTEVTIAHTILFEGTTLGINALSFAQRVGKSGVLGISLVSVDFGDIQVTTENTPAGTGATFSPNFFHLGIGYAKTFGNKVSVGLLVRTISESTADLSALGVALDAGVQYVTGENDNFKFGISLRNIGSPMKFSGDGLSFRTGNPGGDTDFDLTISQRSARYELPSVLNIGLSYDFLIGETVRLTPLANFTSNSFSKDQIGGGVEFAFKEMFMARVGYKYDMGKTIDTVGDNAYSGLAAGISLEVPFKKNGESRFSIDYAYRATNPFNGTHNFGISFKI
jgi:Type IX secretion system membrane protein PorP/SprF